MSDETEAIAGLHAAGVDLARFMRRAPQENTAILEPEQRRKASLRDALEQARAKKSLEKLEWERARRFCAAGPAILAIARERDLPMHRVVTLMLRGEL